jgi:hypothetical protein
MPSLHRTPPPVQPETLPPVPEPAWVPLVLLECHERGIGEWATRKAVECAKVHGTVQCLAVLDQEDRDAIESILPEQPVGNWFRPEFAGYWTI